MRDFTRIAQIAQRQYGALSTEQAFEQGFTASDLHRLVMAGVLARPARGTLLATGSPPSWEQAVLVAVLTAGSEALASHQTAAYLWRLTDRRPEVVEVVMHRWDRAVRAFTVHESTDLLPEDASRVGPIPVTTPVRTVVDLGASAPWLVESSLEQGVRSRLFALEDVARFIARVGRRGRRGVGVIRPMIKQRLQWDGLTESALEDLFRRAWDRSGLLHPTPQYKITDDRGGFVCRTDFAFEEQRLRIELDSEAHHMDRPSFRRDRALQNRTELLGWATLRYTWWDLVTRPEAMVTEIRTALGHPLTELA